MLVDIFHDTACPWCRIGIRNFFAALDRWQEQPIEICWQTFLLDRSIPAEGTPFRSFMKERKGIGSQELEALFRSTQEQGEAAGVKLDFEKISLAVNTILSHRLIAIAPKENQRAIVEEIYKAYFEDGLNIGNIDVLISIGEAAGMDAGEVRHSLSSEAVKTETTSARRQGVFHVPTFIIDEAKIRVDGSNSPEVFLRTLNRAALLSRLNPPHWS